MYERSDKLGLKLCEILGIDPKNVTRLVIDIAVEAVPKIYIVRQNRLLESEQCRQVEKVLAEVDRPEIIEVPEDRGR